MTQDSKEYVCQRNSSDILHNYVHTLINSHRPIALLMVARSDQCGTLFMYSPSDWPMPNSRCAIG